MNDDERNYLNRLAIRAMAEADQRRMDEVIEGDLYVIPPCGDFVVGWLVVALTETDAHLVPATLWPAGDCVDVPLPTTGEPCYARCGYAVVCDRNRLLGENRAGAVGRRALKEVQRLRGSVDRGELRPFLATVCEHYAEESRRVQHAVAQIATG